MAAGHGADGIAEVAQLVSAVGDYRPSADPPDGASAKQVAGTASGTPWPTPVGVGASPVARDTLDPGVPTKLSGQGFGLPVGQQVHEPTELQVEQGRPVTVAPAAALRCYSIGQGPTGPCMGVSPSSGHCWSPCMINPWFEPVIIMRQFPPHHLASGRASCGPDHNSSCWKAGDQTDGTLLGRAAGKQPHTLLHMRSGICRCLVARLFQQLARPNSDHHKTRASRWTAQCRRGPSCAGSMRCTSSITTTEQGRPVHSRRANRSSRKSARQPARSSVLISNMLMSAKPASLGDKASTSSARGASLALPMAPALPKALLSPSGSMTTYWKSCSYKRSGSSHNQPIRAADEGISQHQEFATPTPGSASRLPSAYRPGRRDGADWPCSP